MIENKICTQIYRVRICKCADLFFIWKPYFMFIWHRNAIFHRHAFIDAALMIPVQWNVDGLVFFVESPPQSFLNINIELSFQMIYLKCCRIMVHTFGYVLHKMHKQTSASLDIRNEMDHISPVIWTCICWRIKLVHSTHSLPFYVCLAHQYAPCIEEKIWLQWGIMLIPSPVGR